MNTRKKLYLFIFLASIMLITAGIILHTIVKAKIRQLLTQQIEHTIDETNMDFASQAHSLQTNVYDNSFWDEMVEFTKTRNEEWVRTNLISGMHSHDAAYLWILNRNGGEITSRVRDTFDKPYPLALTPAFIDSIAQYKYITDFYVKADTNLLHVFIAPIQPSSDVKRITPRYGFYAMGRIINNRYLAAVARMEGDINYQLVTYTGNVPAHEVGLKDCRLSLYLPLNILGKEKYAIKTTRVFNDLSLFFSFFNGSLVGFLGVLVGVLSLLMFMLAKLVFVPMGNIATALRNNSTAPIDDLAKQQDEFGSTAKLLNDFFAQRNQLKSEVETRKQSEEALQQAVNTIAQTTTEKVKAEEAAAAKSEFLSTMSHEIRTPINGVVGITNLLLDENLPPHILEYIKTLKFSSNHLLALVTDILDFSKIEKGNIEFESRPFSLRHVCNSIYQLFSIKAKEKGLQFNYDNNNNERVMLQGDAVRLSQVLTNIVSNAVKFTEKGSVDFSYTIAYEQDKANVQFVIADTGIGIAEEEKEKIFTSFSQANKSITGKFGGTGLGLTISKKLVELQDGSIIVNSTKDVGTQCIINLPFTVVPYTAVEDVKITTATTGNSLKGMRILVAEDNAINVLVLQRFLQKWDTAVTITNNGKELLQKILLQPYDVILMDLQMPELDGRETTNMIRNDEAYAVVKDIPIIALTADASLSTQELLLTEGFQHYITKPFNPNRLFQVLRQYCK
jgi:signal transduction histidine kinase/ActR/RegA family two-component response regulator